ncbi:hypothetical protein R3P38DRAFT_3610209 [Favolaschia claudopus]|uniref:Uncharacterized protein n=1 Tax=Favolaschia claudopus TaxID=2862362 RepID=A0AAW0A818_9AGAR
MPLSAWSSSIGDCIPQFVIACHSLFTFSFPSIPSHRMLPLLTYPASTPSLLFYLLPLPSPLFLFPFLLFYIPSSLYSPPLRIHLITSSTSSLPDSSPNPIYARTSHTYSPLISPASCRAAVNARHAACLPRHHRRPIHVHIDIPHPSASLPIDPHTKPPSGIGGSAWPQAWDGAGVAAVLLRLAEVRNTGGAVKCRMALRVTDEEKKEEDEERVNGGVDAVFVLVDNMARVTLHVPIHLKCAARATRRGAGVARESLAVTRSRMASCRDGRNERRGGRSRSRPERGADVAAPRRAWVRVRWGRGVDDFWRGWRRLEAGRHTSTSHSGSGVSGCSRRRWDYRRSLMPDQEKTEVFSRQHLDFFVQL